MKIVGLTQVNPYFSGRKYKFKREQSLGDRLKNLIPSNFPKEVCDMYYFKGGVGLTIKSREYALITNKSYHLYRLALHEMIEAFKRNGFKEIPGMSQFLKPGENGFYSDKDNNCNSWLESHDFPGMKVHINILRPVR